LEDWGARIAIENHHKTRIRFYDGEKYAVRGLSAINDRGVRQIEWPDHSDTGEPAGLDLLLATTTKPTPDPRTGDYATVEQIAGAWLKTGDDQYFRRNRENGFHTFQDKEIEKHLRG
jgi:hypothetical protein